MNPFKFAFIICTNNELYLTECLHYISLLDVPDGYETDIITIKDAPSMAAGYNEGMLSTDARYKIYMHQDVFITNRFFLSDLLSIFATDPAIGMIGMVGYPDVSFTGVMWEYTERLGANPCYGCSTTSTRSYPDADYSAYRWQAEDGICDVALIDGLMIVTSQDMAWDDATLQGWDYYDAFQSMAFLLAGYRIVVPVQKLPWFIHDDGCFLSLWEYNKYRKIFMEKYKNYLGKSYKEIQDSLNH